MQEIQRVLHGVDRSRPLLVLFSAPEHEARATRPLPARLSGGQASAGEIRAVVAPAQAARLQARSEGPESPDESGNARLSPEQFVEELVFSVLLTPAFAATAAAVLALAWYLKRRASEAERIATTAREQAERLELEAKKVRPFLHARPRRQRPAVAGCVGSHHRLRQRAIV
jgi:hypothetical protein